MALIGSVNNQGSIQGQINSANGYLTGVISTAELVGGQVVGMRGLKGDKGDTGDTGATGNGIANVAYVSSVGLVDTYKITYTNGNETTFTVTNGQDGNDGHSPVVTATKSGKKTYISVDGTQIAEVDDGADGTNGTNGVGISSIAKTSTAGKVDTYTITYTNGNTATFTVTNGNDGASGHSPVVTASKVGKTTTVSVDGTAIATILDGNDGNSPTITTSKTGKTTTILSDGTSIGTVLDGDDGNSPVITTSKTGGTTTIYSDGVSIGTVDDGDKGDTPVITASKTGKITTIYADGVSIATINDGTDGVVQDVTVNGTSVLDGTTAKVLVPTKTSDLNNDSLFARGHIGAFHGTCASSASATTKVVTCDDFTASDLVAGAMIVVSFSNANSGAVADLKLNVNGTGAYAIKQNSSGTLSSLGDKGYLKASSYPFIFNGSYWICWYDTNTNTIGYTIRTNGHTLPVKTACYRYRICFTSPDGKNYIPANASTSTSATASKTVTTEKIDPFGRIIYYSYTTAISANGTIGASYQMQQYNGVTLGYSFNRTGVALTMTTNKPVYVKCSPQTDGSAIIDGTTPFVQDLPTTEDGKIYIFIGVATSATAIEFTLEHPVYCYKNGCVRQWTNADIPTIPVTDVKQNGTSVLDGTVAKVVTHDVPSGGTSGQVLSKDSNDDYDLAWITVSGGGGDVVYATSSDTASTVAKTATIVSGTLSTLTAGVQAIVKFAETNTASSPTLNIGGTGAKSIKRYGTTAVGQNQNESWVAGSPVLLVYDGTNWVISGWLNTTYSGGTAGGITTGTDNLNYIWSPKQIHDGIVGLADANVQSDWNEADNTKDDYIKNKPTIPANTSDLVNDSGFITSSDIPSIPTITDTYNGTSSDGMSGKAVKSAIDSLDGTVSGTAGSSKTLTAFSQTDGKVSATFGNISITKSQVSDFAHTHTKSDVTDFTHSHTKSDITDFPTIPTDTGDLTNNAGFITSSDIPVNDVEVNGSSVVNASGVAEITVPTVPSMADYVTEKGTSGDWYYEKWNSGKVEAWGLVATGTLTMTRHNSMLWRATNIALAIPSGIFTEAPTWIEGFIHATNTNIVQVWVQPDTATSANAQVWRNENSTSSVNVRLHCVYYPSTY